MSKILILILLLTSYAYSGEIVYKNSFENVPKKPVDTFNDQGNIWSLKSNSVITEKFANTGKKSLHMTGGEASVVEVKFSESSRSAKGIEFLAERWTGKAPFEFKLELERNGVWESYRDLSSVIAVGARFKSTVRLAIPEGKITGLKFTCKAPENTGVLIDDFALMSNEPEQETIIPQVADKKIRQVSVDKAIFVSGTDNTRTFRIPAIITAKNGDLIAACDARRKSGTDLIYSKDIDIVIKRSSDNGKTWTDMEIVGGFGEGYPASDPSFVLDDSSGEIYCFYNYMDQLKAPKIFRLWYQTSKDHGKSWSKPRDITDEICPKAWHKDFKFITSGRGIYSRDGEILHTIVNLKRGLFVYGSKDHGKSWYLKDTAIKPGDESKIIELNEGLMINSRVNGNGFRWSHLSKDGGNSWKSKKELQLVDPGCNGSFIRYTSVKDGAKKDRLLFSNANSFKGRKNLTVRLSYDEGKTWTDGRVIFEGSSAYSSLTVCKDGSIGVLYEANNYKEIRYANFTLEDLTDGRDSLAK